MPESIAALTAEHLDLLVEHLIASAAENGANGDPLNAPYGPDYVVPGEKAREVRAEAWSKSVRERGWQRAWGLFHNHRIVGHVELHGSGLASELHRANIGLAVEREFRRRGHARALMQTCIDWARQSEAIAWLDLGVFARNRGAHELYRQLGFSEVGRLPDRFRIGCESITDISMTLALRP